MSIFYAEDDGQPSGGGDFSATVSEVFESPETAAETKESVPSTAGDGGAVGAGASAKPTTPALTPEQITAAVREGVRPAEQPREYTQEELDQIFKVWKPNEEVVQQLLAGGADGLKALTAVREGLAAQFTQLLNYQLEVLKREFANQYGPTQQFVTEAKAEKDRETFFKSNEDLREHPNLVDIAYKSLLGEGKQYPTLELAQKALADRARQLIPNGNGSGTTQSGGARSTTTAATKPKPATLSSGSQAGGSGGSSAPPNVFHEIFGPR